MSERKRLPGRRGGAGKRTSKGAGTTGSGTGAAGTGGAAATGGGAGAAAGQAAEPETLRAERAWYGLVALSAIFAIPAALAVIAFVLVVNTGTELVWTTLPEQLGVPREAWIVLIPTLAGLLTGVVIRYAPGGVGPRPAEGHGLGGNSHAGPAVLPGVIAAAVISLVGGASLGPEAPLVTIIGGIAAGIAVRMGLPDRAEVALTAAGISSMISGIFGSPFASVILFLEAIPFGGRALYRRVFPAVLAACVGYAVFSALGIQMAGTAYPDPGRADALQLVATILIAAASAGLGLLFVRVFHLFDGRLRRFDAQPVLKAAWGGLMIGVIALVAGEQVLFSGEHEIGPIALDAAGLGISGLLVILVGKVAVTLVSLATGFRGGRIFPVMFLGGTLGALATLLVPGVPLAVAVGAGMVGAGSAIFRLPLFVVIFAAFFTTIETIPLLLVAAVVAYVIVDGRPELGTPPDAKGEDPRDDAVAAAPASV